MVLQFEQTGAGAMDEGDLSNRYLWGDAVDQLLADEQVDWGNSQADGDTLWALTDHLGTVRDLVDDTGAVQNHKSYNAFGNVTAETNAAVDTAFGYTGKLLDDDTGLQNNLNRWYDPRVGKWASEDPIGFWAGDANLNRYVGGMPTNYIDPDGRERVDVMPFSISAKVSDIRFWFQYHFWDRWRDPADWRYREDQDELLAQSGPDNPPPPGIPGGPFKWCEDKQNKRGGTWNGPPAEHGARPPIVSWDPVYGHWDLNPGTGPRERYDEDGNPLPEGQHRCAPLPLTGPVYGPLPHMDPGQPVWQPPTPLPGPLPVPLPVPIVP